MILNDKLSITISNIRFPLIVGVVLIHGKIGIDNFQHLCSDLLPSACVPIFFMMSAFLFFFDWKGDIYKFSHTTSKLKKRLRILVIPYLFWNTLTIMCFATMHIFLPSMINSEFENVPKWGWQDYLAAYWNGSGGFPISYPLWFLRDLILMTYCAPLFYLLVYKMGMIRWIALVCFTFMYFANDSGTVMGLFYFYCGVFFAWCLNCGYEIKRKTANLVCVISILLFVLLIISNLYDLPLVTGHTSLMRLTGAIGIVGVFFNLTERGFRLPTWLGDCSFFIYLFHALPLLVISRVLIAVLHPTSSIMWSLIYLLNITIIVAVSIAAYYILKKKFVRVTSFITGGR